MPTISREVNSQPIDGETYSNIASELVMADNFPSMNSFLGAAIRNLETYTTFGIGVLSEVQKVQLQERFAKHENRLKDSERQSINNLSYLGQKAFFAVETTEDTKKTKRTTHLELHIPPSESVIPVALHTETLDQMMRITSLNIEGEELLHGITVVIDPTVEVAKADIIANTVTIKKLASVADLLRLLHEVGHITIESKERYFANQLRLVRFHFFSRLQRGTFTRLQCLNAINLVTQELGITKEQLLQPLNQEDIQFVLDEEREANVWSLRFFLNLTRKSAFKKAEDRRTLFQQAKQFTWDNYNTYAQLDDIVEYSQRIVADIQDNVPSDLFHEVVDLFK